MKLHGHYPNRRSRWILTDAFDRQFVLPVGPPPLLAAAVRCLERVVLPQDVGLIQIDRPIFIVGLPRSGTTLLQDILVRHRNVAYLTHAMHLYHRSVYGIEWVRKRLKLDVKGERYLQDSLIVEAGSAAEPAMLWTEWVERDPNSLTWPERRLADLQPGAVAEIERTLKHIVAAFAPDGSRLLFKYPAFTTEVRLLQELFPDARFIHIVRDGRHVANSMVKLCRICRAQLARIRHPMVREIVPYPRVPRLAEYVERFGADDLRCTAHVWRDGIRFLNAARQDLRAFLELRYEDLLADPVEQIEKVLAFCELPVSIEATLALRKKLDEVGVITHVNAYGEFETVEDIAKPELQQYGYC